MKIATLSSTSFSIFTTAPWQLWGISSIPENRLSIRMYLFSECKIYLGFSAFSVDSYSCTCIDSAQNTLHTCQHRSTSNLLNLTYFFLLLSFSRQSNWLDHPYQRFGIVFPANVTCNCASGHVTQWLSIRSRDFVIVIVAAVHFWIIYNTFIVYERLITDGLHETTE